MDGCAALFWVDELLATSPGQQLDAYEMDRLMITTVIQHRFRRWTFDADSHTDERVEGLTLLGRCADASINDSLSSRCFSAFAKWMIIPWRIQRLWERSINTFLCKTDQSLSAFYIILSASMSTMSYLRRFGGWPPEWLAKMVWLNQLSFDEPTYSFFSQM